MSSSNEIPNMPVTSEGLLPCAPEIIIFSKKIPEEPAFWIERKQTLAASLTAELPLESKAINIMSGGMPMGTCYGDL